MSSFEGSQRDNSRANTAQGDMRGGDTTAVNVGSGKQASDGESGGLKKENAILKDQLQRSLKELKGYQEKYPSAYVNVPPSVGDELPPW